MICQTFIQQGFDMPDPKEPHDDETYQQGFDLGDRKDQDEDTQVEYDEYEIDSQNS